MSRQKHYIDQNVLTAAIERLHHIYDLFDTVAVCFSGGKDSLVALHLTHQVAKERGIKRIPVIFRDEELIPDPVLQFVDEYRQLPWIDMDYYAVPLKSHKFILGRTFEYIQWDPTRKWLREKPDFAIQLPAGDDRVFDQYSMDAFAAQKLKGKIAFVTGIRAAESMMRFRASVNKLNENYINATEVKNVMLCKPIYDWEENDVFRFFFEREIRYCPHYDAQHLAGCELRVATPLHAEQSKRIGQLRAIAPTFYQQVMDLFPEMIVQERYYGELDREAIVRQYGQDFDGVLSYIMDTIEDENEQALAIKRLEGIVKRHGIRPSLYPPAYVLKYFMAGSFKRELLPFVAARARTNA